MSWLIVAAVLALLLCTPIGVDAEYDRGFSLYLTVFFFRRRLIPSKPKKAKPKKTPKPTAAAPANAAAAPASQKKPKKSPRLDWAKHWREYLSLILRFLRELRHKLCVRELTLIASYGGADEAERALGYGRAWAAIGMALPPLEGAFRIRKREVRAELTRDASPVRLYGRLHISLLVIEGLILGLTALWRYWKIIRKDGANHE